MADLTGRVLEGPRGRYRVLERLGGHMGIVYKGQELASGNFVAIKRLPASMAQDGAYLQALEREWRAITEFRHPNIVRPVDAFRLGNEYFLVMEFVDGQTLDEMLAASGKPLPLHQGIRYVVEAARAVGYLHQRGVVHRDISPGNIMVTRDGQVKVTDFGLAHPVNEETSAGDRRFKQYFVSAPEIFEARPSSPASDVYSLAATLFKVLTGRYPFEGEDPSAVAYKHVKERPPNPRKFNRRIPRRVAQVILKGLAKDPEQRYPSGEAFAKALEEAYASNRGSVLPMLLGVAAVLGMVGLLLAVLRVLPPPPPPTQATATVVATLTGTVGPTMGPTDTPVPSPTGTPVETATDTPVPTPTEPPPTPTPAPRPTPTPTKLREGTVTPPTPPDCPDPQSRITSPGEGTVVVRDQPLEVRGTAFRDPGGPAFDYYKVEVESPRGGWIVGVKGSDAHTTEAVLGWLDFKNHRDLKNLPAGTHTVRLVVVDVSGNYPSPCQVSIRLVER